MIRALILLLCFSSPLLAFEKLDEAYLVRYGSSTAPVEIVQYFSFTCPHCIALYRKQFQEIKERYLDSHQVSWVFHPVPMDLLTVQAMECLRMLLPREKRIFLEAILEEVVIDNTQLSGLMLQKGIEMLGHPIPDLLEKSYISDTQTFQDAFLFLKQEDMLSAVPAAEIDGSLDPGQVPDLAWIEEKLAYIGGRL